MKLYRLLMICLFFRLLLPTAVFAGQPLDELLDPLVRQHPGKTGMYILEKGGEALLARGWLADRAARTIDVQYFIWGNDNIGKLAAETLLRAAQRGVHVRVLVDDLLIDASSEELFALAHHPNVDVRIYNPVHNVGVNFIERLSSIALNFRGSNQRMHNKMFVVDNKVAITGGRNMEDQYFDFGHAYNYRDRDALMVGQVINELTDTFNLYWNSELAVPVEQLINNPFQYEVNWSPDDDWGDEIEVDQKQLLRELSSITDKHAQQVYDFLHAYANDDSNYLPEVRESMNAVEGEVSDILQSMYWVDATFISDQPGKNNTWFNLYLGGGGGSTDALAQLLNSARDNVVIQSPYLVLSGKAQALFEQVLARGVTIKINTNSLTSSDNLPAYSGYSSQLDELLEAGIDIYEYRPDAQRRQQLVKRYTQYDGKALPIFSLHAKTMVVDDSIVYIGTFNLDPRSENLNTEVGVIAHDKDLAKAVKREIEIDMQHGNSWNVRKDGHNNGASILKRSKLFLWKLFPLDPIL